MYKVLSSQNLDWCCLTQLHVKVCTLERDDLLLLVGRQRVKVIIKELINRCVKVERVIPD